MVWKFSMKSSHIEIKIFQTTSYGEMRKNKVLNPEELYNFVIDNFFI